MSSALTGVSVSVPVVGLLGLGMEVYRTLRPSLDRMGVTVTACPTVAAVTNLCNTVEVGCVVAETDLPGSGVLGLLQELGACAVPVPVVIFSVSVDVTQVVRAMKAGAFDCLENRGDVSKLVETVSVALDYRRRLREKYAPRRDAMMRASRLTRREREVFQLVVEGLANKQVAHRLGIADKTVETHRSRVMGKMEARTLAELVRMAHVMDMFQDETGIEPQCARMPTQGILAQGMPIQGMPAHGTSA